MNAPNLQQMLLIERACDRFESAQQLGTPLQIEAVLRERPELESALLRPLLTLEIDYRRQRGEKPRWSDYRERFPQATAVLEELLGKELTTAQLLQQLSQLQMLPDEELHQLARRIKRTQPPPSGETLLEELIEAGQLTPWQAQRLAERKGKTLLLGEYLIHAALGQGAMGAVWKARRPATGEWVALKVLDPDLAKNPDMVRRFQREARVALQLRHPQIVATHALEMTAAGPYLVMEYIDGHDLAARVKQTGPLPPLEALGYVRQAATGLAYAHAQGVIHRDVKPSNLIVDSRGALRILDLGLARVLHHEGQHSNLTATGDILGTVDFMAPEQSLASKQADARSDIYSLGAVLWYLLTGRPLYEARSMMSRMLAHREQPIPSLVAAVAPTAGAELPKVVALEPVFERMVAKSPADRFPSMTAVVEALSRAWE